MRLAETVYAERDLDDPPGRELADAALVLATAGSARWAEIAARVVEAWPEREQVGYLRDRREVMPETVFEHFSKPGVWPDPVGAGEQMVELVEIEGGAILTGDGKIDPVLDGTLAPSSDEVVAQRFNQIETRLDQSDERLSQFESALAAHEAGLQIVAASLSRHIIRSGALPRWRTLEEFKLLVIEVMGTEQVPLDQLAIDPAALPTQEG
jgi:hypothetical protein